MPGFMKIVNGEVITDPNYPRLRNAQPSSSSSMYPSSSASSSGPAGRSGSSFGSPFSQRPGASGNPGAGGARPNDNLFGLPDFTLFDVTMKPQHYIVAILLAVFGGTPGLVFVLVMFFTYRYYIKSVRGNPPQAGARGAFDGFLDSIFGGGGAPPPPGQGGRGGGLPPPRRGGGFGRL